MSTYGIRFAAALTDKFADERNQPTFEAEAGRKYDKIIQSDKYGSRHVHAFVDRKTGAVIKAASWKAPQKDKDGIAVRYHLDSPDGFFEAIEAADQFGGYLYK
jgi:hypothetical protein